MPTNTQNAILPKDVLLLIEAGFLTSDIKITDDCAYYLRHLAFIANKDAIVKRAKEIIAERSAVVE